MHLIFPVVSIPRCTFATVLFALATFLIAPPAHAQSWVYFGPDSANWHNVTRIDGQFKPGAPPILGVGTTVGVALYDSGSWRYPATNHTYNYGQLSSISWWYNALWFSPWEDTLAFLFSVDENIEFETTSLTTLGNFQSWSGNLGGVTCDFSWNNILFAASTIDTQQAYVQICNFSSSTNDGRTWSNLQIPTASFTCIAADLVLPNTVYGLSFVAGTPDSLKIFSSADAGTDWAPVPNPIHSIVSANIVAANGTLIVAIQTSADSSASAGIYFHSSSANGWTHPLTGLSVQALTANRLHPERIYAATDAGIYKSTDTGATWAPYNQKLPLASFSGLVVDPYTDNLYLASDSGVIRVISGTLGVPVRPGIPAQFRLSQNYPNPFNPTTTIHYEIPRAAFVHPAVYNVLGQEVRTLVNQSEQPGFKSVAFNAGALTSGVYFYKITTGAFTDVKKMLLIR